MSKNTPSPQNQLGEEFAAKIIAKAWVDENFKQELLNDPLAVFERESGKKAPDGMQVTVLEESPLHYYLILPIKPSLEVSQEPTEEALEEIALGWYAIKSGDRWVAGSTGE
jgi:hypothetical protein